MIVVPPAGHEGTSGGCSCHGADEIPRTDPLLERREGERALAVADVPPEHVTQLGGLKQQRVRGAIGGAAFGSNVMPAGGGRLALSVSKAMMSAASVTIGDEVDFEISGTGHE